MKINSFLSLIFAANVLFAQPIPTNGLVFEMTFNAGNFNENIGYCGGGTQHGGVTLTADRFGNQGRAVAFNGTNACLTIASCPKINFANNNNFTVSLWAQANAIQNNIVGPDNDILAKWFNGATTNGYPFGVRCANQTAPGGKGFTRLVMVEEIVDKI